MNHYHLTIFTPTRVATFATSIAVAISVAACGSDRTSTSANSTPVAVTNHLDTVLSSPASTTSADTAVARTAPTTSLATAVASPAPIIAAPTTTSSTSTTSTTSSPATSGTVAPTKPPTTAAAPSHPTGTVDELVLVDAARMHVRCTGSGNSTVVLIAGFTNDHTSFGLVEPAIAEGSRVCSYDRFGTGTSDPPPQPQTFETQARDLRTALSTLGEPGPFVVVGHSFGGDVAVTFTNMYRAEVTGLLLLEASPATWNSTACSVEDDGSEGALVWLQTCALQAEPANNVEGLAGPAAFAELAQIGSFGDLPMIVDTAAEHDYTGGNLDPDTAARLTAAWFDGQDHWTSLSSNAQLIPVDGSGHHIQLDRPELVIEQIHELTR